jgi:tail assembly chaperone
MSIKKRLEALSASLGPSVQEKTVKVGEAAETFHFKRLSYLENQRVQMIPFTVDKDGKPSFNAKKAGERNCAYLAAALCDEAGVPQLTAKDVESLEPQIAEALLKAANEVNGTNDKAVEDAVKNSEATAGDDTSSA